MRRDQELIRKILLHIENLPTDQVANSIQIDGYDENIITEHVVLLEEAEYIEARLIYGFNPKTGKRQVRRYIINRLKNEGHDFIASAKDEKVWNQAMKIIREKSEDASLAIVKGLLIKLAAQKLGI